MIADPLVTWAYVEQWANAALDKAATCPPNLDTHDPLYVEWEALSQVSYFLLLGVCIAFHPLICRIFRPFGPTITNFYITLRPWTLFYPAWWLRSPVPVSPVVWRCCAGVWRRRPPRHLLSRCCSPSSRLCSCSLAVHIPNWRVSFTS